MISQKMQDAINGQINEIKWQTYKETITMLADKSKSRCLYRLTFCS